MKRAGRSRTTDRFAARTTKGNKPCYSKTTALVDTDFGADRKTARVVIDLETMPVHMYREVKAGVTRVVFRDGSASVINMSFDAFHEAYQHFKQNIKLGLNLER